jgi:serine/threonine-protein kinase HipA
MALELFKHGFVSEAFKLGSQYTKTDFYEFAGRIGIKETRCNKICNSMLDKSELVEDLIQKSFLSNDLKNKYLESYFNKLGRLRS